MKNLTSVKRRDFLKGGGAASAVAITAPLFVSSRVFGANDKVNMGIIGPGRRGSQLMGDFSRLNDAQFVAISDLNSDRMDRVADGKTWKKCKDFRDLLALKEVDAVIVATPDHWHVLCAMYACMAEKDVYVEKPMTLTIHEGRALTNAARKYKRVVQCGSQQRSSTRSRYGCELVRNEAAGKVIEVHGYNYESPWDQPLPTQPVPPGIDWDRWLGPTPLRGYHEDIYTPRANPGWISLVPYSGGEVTGWGAHGLDMIQWALGTDDTGPVEIWSEGSFRTLNRPVHMKYANGVVVKMDGQGPEGGAVFICEKGKILVDRDRYEITPSSLDPGDESKFAVKLEVSPNHQQNFLDCVKSRNKPIADVEIGHRSSIACHMINLARWTNRKLQWDPVKETFIGDDDANTYLDRPRRKPWELPTI
ncbi:MAG: twin-arginine translocation signal domain-containing protein [bacterium]|nr:twin-arginine translocation signal domain-containing protein [bacterium]